MAYESLFRRQTENGSGDGPGDYGGYGNYGSPNSTQNYDDWFSNKGLAVRYATTVGVVVLIVLLFTLAYVHGRRRMRKGLPLLTYHRWMFKSRHSATSLYWGNPSGQHRGIWRYSGQNAGPPPPANSAYAMNSWQYAPAPPPAYHENVPPAYQPPPGASKVAPLQTAPEVQAGNDSNNNDNPGSSTSPAPHPPTPAAPAPSYYR